MRLRRNARREANQQPTSSASASAEPSPEAPVERVRRRRNVHNRAIRFPREIERTSERLRQRGTGSDQDLSRLEATVSQIRNYRPVVRIPRLPISDSSASTRASQRRTLRDPRPLGRIRNPYVVQDFSVIDLTSSDTEASIASSIIPTLGQTTSSSDSSSSSSSDSSNSSDSLLTVPPFPLANHNSDSESSIDNFSTDEE